MRVCISVCVNQYVHILIHTHRIHTYACVCVYEWEAESGKEIKVKEKEKNKQQKIEINDCLLCHTPIRNKESIHKLIIGKDYKVGKNFFTKAPKTFN